MALSFGWRANDVRESHWIDDPAFQNVSEAARQSWLEDGDSSHLAPFAKAGKPELITFRNLTPDETRVVSAYFADQAGTLEGYARATLACFRIAVDFPGAEETIRGVDGGNHPRIVKERGIRMLANEFVSHMETAYKGMVAFYGGLILRASFATDAEKKASSPPSTPTPSKAEESTPATTEGSQTSAGA